MMFANLHDVRLCRSWPLPELTSGAGDVGSSG
jgi:hypothetical protein